MKFLNAFLSILIICLWLIPAPVQAADPIAEILFPFLKPPVDNPIREDAIYVGSSKYVAGQEIVEKRQENTKTTYMGDGKYSLDVYKAPIHYKDNYGSSMEQWKDIDTTIVNGRIDKAPYIAVFDYSTKSVTVTDKKTGSVTIIGMQSLGVTSLAGKGSADVSKNIVTWQNIATDTDVKIIAENSVIRLQRVLKSSVADTKATFNISQSGTGIKLGYQAQASKPTTLPIVTSISNGVLTEDIDKAKAGTITYPLTIDPTLDLQVGASGDDCLQYKHWGAGTYWSIVYTGIQPGYYDATFHQAGSGMRFLNVTIPASSTISTASIDITANSIAGTNAAVQWYTKIRIEDNVSPATYGTEADWDGRSWYGTTVTWSGNTAWVTDTEYTSPEIKALMQYIVNKGGWASGNNISLSWDDFDNLSSVATGIRNGYSYDGSTTKCAKLHIEYTNPAAALPTTSTNTTALVEETTCTMNGQIISGTNVNFRGFAWGTTSNSTQPVNETPPASYTANYTESGTYSVGTFSYNKTGLTSGDRYYLRAYSANATGYGWGATEDSFLTKPNEPTGFTCTSNSSAVDLAWTNATVGVGTTLYTTVRYKTGGYPASITDGTLSYNGTASNWVQAGLVDGTPYYFRAWSFCWDGALSQLSDSYGSCSSTPFTSSVTTKACTGFGTNWAVVNGSLLVGTTLATQVGFDYGLTTAYGESSTNTGTYSSGGFSIYLHSLSKGTVYHYRAKALVGGVWKYGGDMVFATKGSPVIYDYWDSGGDSDSMKINSANITYQTFTTNTTAIPHSVTTITLWMKKVGTPGDVTAGVRSTSNSTLGATCLTYPTGANLASGTLDGSTFSTLYGAYVFTMGTEACLSSNTTYAIVVSCADGDASNYVLWQADAGGGYAGGNAGYTVDSGTTWTNACPADQLFEVWGNPCIEVNDAKVFTTYIESGDWLITCLYKNLYPPYYAEAKDVSQYFVLQLYNATTDTVIAQTKCFEWGYKPGAIYLSPTMVTSLQWGYAYRVRLYGLFTGNPYAEYVLQPTDWMGSDLSRLDSWVRSCASLMETYYNTDLTTYLTDRGVVLNSAGGVIFATDIPQLSVIRPGLFSIVTQTHQYVQGEYNQAYQDTLVWQVMLGPQLTKVFTTAGNTVGVSGATIGSWIGFLIYALVALFCFRPGHAIAAMVIPIPILLVSFGTGLLELALMGILIAVATVLFVWQFWWKQG